MRVKGRNRIEEQQAHDKDQNRIKDAVNWVGRKIKKLEAKCNKKDLFVTNLLFSGTMIIGMAEGAAVGGICLIKPNVLFTCDEETLYYSRLMGLTGLGIAGLKICSRAVVWSLKQLGYLQDHQD